MIKMNNRNLAYLFCFTLIFCWLLQINFIIKFTLVVVSIALIKLLKRIVSNTSFSLYAYIYISLIVEYSLFVRKSENIPNASLYTQYLEIVIFLIVIVVIIMSKPKLPKKLFLNESLFLIYIFGIFINVIVTNNCSTVNLYWIARYLVYFLVAINLERENRKKGNTPIQLYNIFIISVLISNIILVFIGLLLPGTGIVINIAGGLRLGGTIVHPATLGIMNVLAFIISWAIFENDKRPEYLYLCCILPFVILATYSRVPIVILLVFIFIAYFTGKASSSNKIIVIVSLAFLTLVFLYIFINNNRISGILINLITRNSGISNIKTMTGRSEIWKYITLDIFSLNGNGYMSSESFLEVTNFAVTFENAFLNILYEQGVIQLFIIVLVIITMLKEGYTYRNITSVKYIILFFLSIIVDSLMVPSFGSAPRIHSLLLLYSIVVINSLIKETKSNIRLSG